MESGETIEHHVDPASIVFTQSGITETFRDGRYVHVMSYHNNGFVLRVQAKLLYIAAFPSSLPSFRDCLTYQSSQHRAQIREKHLCC